jgi:hypothetical protein
VNILLHLKQEWDVIVKSPFACVVCLAIGFLVGSWYYAGRLATLDSQVAFWKDKATATPTPAITAAAPTAAPTAAAPAPSAASAPANSAHLTMTAGGASFYTSPSDESLTGIVLDVQIKNSGLPSKATGWRLKVTPKNGAAVAAQYFAIPKQLTVPGNPPVIVRASESLAERVLNKPIQYEQVVSGRLLFYASLPLTTVQDPATKLTLSVQDITGNAFSTELLVGDWLHPRADN